MSAERFERLGKRVNLLIYFGSRYVYDAKDRNKWKVNVEFKDNDVEIKLDETGYDLEVVLQTAYDRLDKIVVTGLGASAMMPALEHKPEQPKVDEEIPF